MGESSGVRRLGAASLDLCYVAAGRFDGFWERGVLPWDIAAGSIVVREAGGFVSSVDGDKFDHLQGEIACGNELILRAMTAELKKANDSYRAASQRSA